MTPFRGIYRFVAVAAVLSFLAACGPTREAPPPSPDRASNYKAGTPYQVGGQWYYPKEEPHYDRMGVASWYGQKFHNRRTANGEIYDMNALTAAHTTLPMPSYVRVTNLD